MIQVQLLGFGSYKRFTMRQSFIYMMEGILLHCPQLATTDMITLLTSFAQDSVINNKICLARLVNQCVKKGKNFEWFAQLFEELVKETEPDLLNILLDTYQFSPKELLRVKEQISKVKKHQKEVLEKEMSFIASLRSESEVESESEDS